MSLEGQIYFDIYLKIDKILKSCKTLDHYITTYRYIELAKRNLQVYIEENRNDRYFCEEDYRKLMKLYQEQEERCKEEIALRLGDVY